MTSAITVAGDNDKITLSALETVCAKEGVNKKRIYRTTNSGEQPFLYRDEITLATTTYQDEANDLVLGEAGPEYGDHDPPPTTSYICLIHLGRCWLAYRNKLYYSLPDDGTGTPLEYFSDDRCLVLPQIITGLSTNRQGTLFVFCPPGYGIWEVTGRLIVEDDIDLVEAFPVIGTFFHTSIRHGGKNADLICFWGPRGPRFVTPQGIEPQGVDAYDEFLRDIITDDYSGAPFVWAEWEPVSGLFLFGLTLSSTIPGGGGDESLLWLDSDTGTAVSWMQSGTGVTTSWEDDS
jgi:hypothetical protein